MKLNLLFSLLGELHMTAEIWLLLKSFFCYLMHSSYFTSSLDNALCGGEEEPVEAPMSQSIGLHFQS
jgi:hypothetical protein